MSVLIPDEILRASGFSEHELKAEIAVMLFEKERLTLGEVSHLAEMDCLAF